MRRWSDNLALRQRLDKPEKVRQRQANSWQLFGVRVPVLLDLAEVRVANEAIAYRSDEGRGDSHFPYT